ncbi:MAG: amino acid transporter [Nocardioidaceae bacterium]
MSVLPRAGERSERFEEWFFEEAGSPGEEHDGTRGDAWWRVMCLTGVDYFSTLGYQPGIALLAAGAMSPVATLVLVLLTLFGALPVYRRVARESPHGEGSIAMLERLLSFWKGKLFVLVLLGFAATDFVITMTLSAADATAHIVENPTVAPILGGHELPITLFMLGILGAVFLRGFREAISLAVFLVGTYLALNVVVIGDGFVQIAQQPHLVADWAHALRSEHPNPLGMLLVAFLVFPQLALGLSGFETGVAVMPHVRGDATDTHRRPRGRIRGTRRLLTAAAVIMSTFLITSSLVTAVLVPADAYAVGGPANGRALAYLAHENLGTAFGSVYDVSTIAILWFAGASAMAGLLNLIPRYLPRYGMAPGWSRATRPLVLVLTGTAFLITWIFDASVDAQGGAYATGVLVLITSAAVAVTLAVRRTGQHALMWGFVLITAVLAYTTVDNVMERPDGVKIGACFIVAIIAVSLLSRIFRAFELRTTRVELDRTSRTFVRDCARRTIRLVAHDPETRSAEEYHTKLQRLRRDHDQPVAPDVIFLEVSVTDPSDFESSVAVHGEVQHGEYRVLTLESSSIPNAIAAVALAIRDETRAVPHVYFAWSEGNPLLQLVRFLLFGVGEVAPVTREVLRRAEPDPRLRPHVHVG